MISIIIRAALLSILLNLASIVTLLGGDQFNPGIFSDWDEPYYLPQPYQSADISFEEFIHIEEGNLAIFSNPKIKLPHYVLDVVVGKISTALGLSPVNLGIVLDLVCCFLGYILFLQILGIICGNSRYNDLGAIVGVAFPWLFSLEELFPGSFSIGSYTFFTSSHIGFPSNPLQRALFTQISVIGFLTVLSLGLSLGTRNHSRTKFYALLTATSLITGALLYAYFFAWLSAACVLALLSIFTYFYSPPPKHKSARYTNLLFTLLLSVIPFTLVSLPGILQLVSGGSLYKPGPGSHLPSLSTFLEFSKFWYFPPLSLLTIGCCLWRQRTNRESIQYGIIAILLTSTIILTNLQPLLGRWLTPYHFAVFFLHPCSSAVLAVMVVKYLSKFRFAPLVSSLIALTVFLPSLKTFQCQVALKEEASLLEYLFTTTPSSATIAVPPYLNAGNTAELKLKFSLLSYALQALSRRASFSNFLNFDADREFHIKRELALGYIYFGTPRFLVPCPDRSKFVIPNDEIISGATSFIRAQRAVDCEILNSLPLLPSTCQLISVGKIDYIVLQKGDVNVLTSAVVKSITSSWSTPNSSYTVHGIDYMRLREEVCRGSEV